MKPETRLDIRDFVGLIDNYDSEDIPASAAEVQVNMASTVSGQISVRRGYKFVSSEQET